MALSRMNKKDPTGALKWERKYEKAILKIVDQFNDDVVDAFTHMWDTGELRTLEAGKFDATRFSPFVDKLADKKLNKPAKRVAKRIVPKAYAQGELFAKTMVEGLFNIVLGDVLGVREKVGELVLKNEIEFKGFSTETSRRINRTISDGIIDGKPKYTIVNDLRDGFEMTRNNATRIVRTETMRATNRGVKDKYRSAGIEVVKWMATIQPGRTCEECKALNGKLFPIDKTPPIPKHPRCRCTLSPVPDPDWSEVEGWDGEQVTPPKKKETSPKEKKKAPKGDMMRPVAKPLSETTREELWENVKLAEDYVEGTDATYLIGKHYIHHGRAHTYIHELKEVPIKDITVTSEDMLDKIPVYKNRGTQAPPVDVSILPDGKYRLFNGHRRLKSAIARKEKNIFVEIIHKAEDITLKGE